MQNSTGEEKPQIIKEGVLSGLENFGASEQEIEKFRKDFDMNMKFQKKIGELIKDTFNCDILNSNKDKDSDTPEPTTLRQGLVEEARKMIRQNQRASKDLEKLLSALNPVEKAILGPDIFTDKSKLSRIENVLNTVKFKVSSLDQIFPKLDKISERLDDIELKIDLIRNEK
jgi:hypothetical protein